MYERENNLFHHLSRGCGVFKPYGLPRGHPRPPPQGVCTCVCHNSACILSWLGTHELGPMMATHYTFNYTIIITPYWQ